MLSEVRRRKSAGASASAQPSHPHSQQNGTGPAGMGSAAHLRHRTHGPANGRTTSARAEVTCKGGYPCQTLQCCRPPCCRPRPISLVQVAYNNRCARCLRSCRRIPDE